MSGVPKVVSVKSSVWSAKILVSGVPKEFLKGHNNGCGKLVFGTLV